MMDPISEIVIATEIWWVGLRPERWTEAQHLENPTVNTTSTHEKMMAIAISRGIQEYVNSHGSRE
jgi:hypothetical protein